MFKWKLNANVDECAGVPLSPNYTFTLLMRFDNKFSPASTPAKVSGNRLRFNAELALEFTTSTEDLPSSNVQIMLVCTANGGKGAGKNEEIIGMATIKISFPLSSQAQALTIHKFDKSFDSKATLKASLSLQKTKVTAAPQASGDALPSGALEEILSLQREENEAYQSHLKFLESELGEELIQEGGEAKGKYAQVLKERNQLYKMSEDLYEQLKKCMCERDEYLKELRERELSEQQTREELEFLKLKIEEHEGGHQETELLIELEQLRDENADLRKELESRVDEARELKRQVRESLIAMDEFRKEALEARSELINKESELSIMTRQSRHLDPYDCIQELYQELQSRRLEDPLCLDLPPAPQYPVEQVIRNLKRETAALFTQLLQRMKLGKDKEWLVQQKVGFERAIDSLAHQ